MGIIVKCSNCGAEIEKSPCHIKRSKNSYCNNQCRSSHTGSLMKGENNPNFGKTWPSERKEKQSEIIKSRVDEEYRENCSKGMRGKGVSEETKKKRKETDDPLFTMDSSDDENDFNDEFFDDLRLNNNEVD